MTAGPSSSCSSGAHNGPETKSSPRSAARGNQLDIVDQQELSQMTRDRILLTRGAIQPQRLLGAKNKHVRDDFALEIRHKRLAALARLQSLDVIRGKAVQKTSSIRARDFNLSPVAQIEESNNRMFGSTDLRKGCLHSCSCPLAPALRGEG